MKRLTLISVLFFMAAACDGSRVWSDRLTDELLDYPEISVVDFNVAGNIVCPKCIEGEVDVVGVRVEVMPKDDPLHDALAVRMLDGVGPFTISNLRYKEGAGLRIICHIYTSVSFDDAGMTKEASVNVPDSDGETVAVTINF